MFLHFNYANTIHYKKSLYSIVVKKNVHKMSSVHGSSVLTVKLVVFNHFSQRSFFKFQLCLILATTLQYFHMYTKLKYM